MASEPIASSRRGNAAEGYDNKREGYEDPFYPSESLQSVELTAVCIVEVAVKTPTQCGRDACGGGNPQNPGDGQEYTMAEHAGGNGAVCRGVQEEGEVEQAEEDGPRGDEEDVVSTVADGGVEVVVVAVIHACQPARNRDLDETKTDKEAEDDGVSPAYMVIDVGHLADREEWVVSRRKAFAMVVRSSG